MDSTPFGNHRHARRFRQAQKRAGLESRRNRQECPDQESRQDRGARGGQWPRWFRLEIDRPQDPQVINGRNHRVDKSHGDQRDQGRPAGLSRIQGLNEHPKLAEEAAKGREPDQGNHDNEDRKPHPRVTARQAVEVFDSVVAIFRTKPNHQGERAEIRDGVNAQIEEEGGDGVSLALRDAGGDQADHQIAGMRDRRVREHTPQPGLRERREVAEGHRGGRKNPHDHDPSRSSEIPEAVLPKSQRVDQQFGQHQDTRDLRARREPARDRRGGSVVGVGRPLMEREQGELETEADQDQQDDRRADDVFGESERLLRLKNGLIDLGELHCVGQAVK